MSGDGTSNLLSPTKNLLPAAANPLYPTSPYYTKPIAPHPSELPLPSLSLTPKKKSIDSQKKNASNTRMHFNLPNLNLQSSESDDNVIDDDESNDNHAASNKLCEYCCTIYYHENLFFIFQYTTAYIVCVRILFI